MNPDPGSDVRDHRELGRDLGLYAVAEPVGAGLPLWLPGGAAIVAELERYVTELERRAGCRHVRTPVIGKRQLYETSGHWQYFADDLFPPMRLGGPDAAGSSDDLVLRPVLCPHHIQVYRAALRSHRELPLRLAEFGPMYRRERSGVLSGLTRVRAITLNDAHHFCAADQVVGEVVRVLELIDEAYDLLGIKPEYLRLSLRDGAPKFAGDDDLWRRAEGYLRAALAEAGRAFEVGLGEAAFYGPKIDVQVLDAHGREFTLSTVQVDLVQPQRFGLEYVAPDGSRRRPVMVHRSILASMERMVAYLLESYGGGLPPWLAPIQVMLVPIGADQLPVAQRLADAMLDRRLRVEIASPEESMGARIRAAHLRKVPYVGVIGAREADTNTISLRSPGGVVHEPRPVSDVLDALEAVVASHSRSGIEIA